MNMGAALIRDVASRANDAAGDGTESFPPLLHFFMLNLTAIRALSYVSHISSGREKMAEVVEDRCRSMT
jgi:chaperonin GroEL (HSP60 family)